MKNQFWHLTSRRPWHVWIISYISTKKDFNQRNWKKNNLNRKKVLSLNWIDEGYFKIVKMNPYNGRLSYSSNNNHLSKPQLSSYSSINSLINSKSTSTTKLNNNKGTHDRWICPNDRVLTLRAK